MIDRLRLPTGTAAQLDEVSDSLRRSLSGDGVTVPLPPSEPERGQVLALVRSAEAALPAAGVVVATSGSTGHPRGVLLSPAALVAAAEAAHRRLGGPGRWVLALPAHYVAGVMVLVRALLADRPVLAVDPRLSGLAAPSPTDGPHYLSLVPTQLDRALGDPARTAALAGFDAVLLGGAAAAPDLLARARSAGIRVVTSYGMSETCGGCVYDGRPLDGVEVELEPGTGQILIGGPTLFSGYLGGPAADPVLRTGDRGRFVDGRLQVLGRSDAVVTSGGHNVDLDAVERELTALTGSEVAVLGLPDARWGTRVAAVGVGLVDSSDRLRAVLPSYAVPRQWVAVAELPRTAGGKIDRQRLIAEMTESVTAQPIRERA